jgi:hypothetical protein
MNIIKSENLAFDGKTYAIKFWQDAAELIAQAFQGITPVSHQFIVKISAIDEMERYYHSKIFEMLKLRVRLFVEECTRLKVERFKQFTLQ